MAQSMRAYSTETPRGESLWLDRSQDIPRFPSLRGRHEADICIIGGGITGLSLAYLLRKTKAKILLVEATRLARGTSGHSSAHLDPFTDESLSDLVETLGPERARHWVERNRQAVAWIESRVKAHQISCDFKRVPAFLYHENSRKQIREYEQEKKAAGKLNLAYSEDKAPVFPPSAVRSLGFDYQAQFDPVRYLGGLAREIDRSGPDRIYENSPVIHITQRSDGTELELPGARIKAGRLVMATHYPIGMNLFIQARVYPYRSYLVAARPSAPLPEGLFWDLRDPYHYLRRVDGPDGPDGPLILVGGEDHKTGHGNPQQAYTRLENYVYGLFPRAEIVYRWSSQFYPSDRGLPYVGSLPLRDNTFIATGYGGAGLTLGTVAAHHLCQLLEGQDVPADLESMLRPSRLDPMNSASRFIRENWNVASRFVGDRARVYLKSIPSLRDLGPGEGRILKHQGRTLGVHRTPQGDLQACSAICTHARCVVQWNGAEQSWDCPCHGGRFRPDGTVLNGPPLKPLEKVELTEPAERDDAQECGISQIVEAQS